MAHCLVLVSGGGQRLRALQQLPLVASGSCPWRSASAEFALRFLIDVACPSKHTAFCSLSFEFGAQHTSIRDWPGEHVSSLLGF